MGDGASLSLMIEMKRERGGEKDIQGSKCTHDQGLFSFSLHFVDLWLDEVVGKKMNYRRLNVSLFTVDQWSISLSDVPEFFFSWLDKQSVSL